MATISVVRSEGEGRTTRFTWIMATGDTGEAVSIPGAADKTVQYTGTFSGSTLIIEGSLAALDTGTYATLTDPQGNAISVTAAGLEAITEQTTWVRPRITGGTATAITITLLCRSTMR
jgi:hypothetical protein